MFPQTISLRNNPLIYTLIGINVLGYLAINQLMQMQGLGPSSCFAGLQAYRILVEGQYWRILSSMFVHYELTHILFNMVALLIFGSYAERFLGFLPALLIYVISGLSANVLALAYVYLYGSPSYCAIGASGAILGLAAATACLMLHLWRKFRNPVAFVFARQLGIILIIQFILDFMVKENSFIHHFTGAATGFLLALALYSRKQLPRA